ncbi:MAG: selenium-dependent molybdenum cofactor biosynthesis protein YqeB [Halobacteria archaeon]
MLYNKKVLVKGAGDFASGTIRRLHLAGCKVVATELEKPLTVRRKVAFSEAIYDGKITVEGVTGVRTTKEGIDKVHKTGKVAVIVDPECAILKERKFDIVIDARSAKKNLGTKKNEAPIVIGIGPGFTAGKDCHAVVESLAGHDLGRVYYKGKAAENTGKPAPPEYYLLACSLSPCCVGIDPESLVLRAPCDGIFRASREIGDIVEKGEVLGVIDSSDVTAGEKGVIRGLIHDGVRVTKGLKIGDIDPTCIKERCFTISEKSNAIAGGVLEACTYLSCKILKRKKK